MLPYVLQYICFNFLKFKGENMKKVAIILAEGFEELEAISIIDILRRANIDLVTVGLDSSNIKGSQHRN